MTDLWGFTRLKLFILSACVFAFAPPGRAFHLSEHERLTRQAAHELSRCFPEASAVINVDWVVNGNLSEDLNYAQKGLAYSHFYHPHKDLKMFRYDSSGRISALRPALCLAADRRATEFSSMFTLGSVVHHLQDMMVPAHVVPVNHGPFDGFESWDFRGDISSGLSCAQIAQIKAIDPLHLLKESATYTLRVLEKTKVRLHVQKGNGERIQTEQGMHVFWKEQDGEGFGEYGIAGNNFGSLRFTSSDLDFEVDPEFYDALKQAQLKAAVRVTVMMYVWHLTRQGADRLDPRRPLQWAMAQEHTRFTPHSLHIK